MAAWADDPRCTDTQRCGCSCRQPPGALPPLALLAGAVGCAGADNVRCRFAASSPPATALPLFVTAPFAGANGCVELVTLEGCVAQRCGIPASSRSALSPCWAFSPSLLDALEIMIFGVNQRCGISTPRPQCIRPLLSLLAGAGGCAGCGRPKLMSPRAAACPPAAAVRSPPAGPLADAVGCAGVDDARCPSALRRPRQ